MGVLFIVLDAKTLTREISSQCDVMSVPVPVCGCGCSLFGGISIGLPLYD